jgi:hypothetical protein
MIKLYVERRKRLSESLDAPCEGIFWIIDNELIAYTDQVDTSGKLSTTLEHRKIWNEIKDKYTDDEMQLVPYDYYPRGRVMVNPIYKDGKFDHYNAYIYMDECIKTYENITDIIYEFRLKNNCDIKYVGSSGGVESGHYVCHNCKGG